MKLQTTVGVPMDAKVLGNYLKNLVNMFFKILPLWEDGEKTLGLYMKTLQAELCGCNEFVEAIHDDAAFLSLLSILQYLIDTPDCDVAEVKRNVFHAISVCNKLKAKYVPDEADGTQEE